MAETETGVTIHFMDESFDTGDIIAQKPYHIHSKATMGTIFNELNVPRNRAFAASFRQSI